MKRFLGKLVLLAGFALFALGFGDIMNIFAGGTELIAVAIMGLGLALMGGGHSHHYNDNDTQSCEDSSDDDDFSDDDGDDSSDD